MCLWAIYIFPGSVHIFSCSRISRPIVGILYINRSQTHECVNWDSGCAIPFLGIFVSNFRYCVFAVQGVWIRETGDGWPLLTVESEVNGVSEYVQIKEVLPWFVHLAYCASTRDFRSALAALVGQVLKFFPHCALFPLLCHHRPVSWPGSRAWSHVS